MRVSAPVLGILSQGFKAQSEFKLCHIGNHVPCIDVAVQFSVHESLFAAGLIPALFVDDRSLDWIAQSDWSLTKQLTSAESPGNLSLDGVLGFAEIFIDNEFVGRTSSAFLEFSLPIAEGKRELRIVIKSAVSEARNFSLNGQEIPVCVPDSWTGFCGVQYVRMPQYFFGWDWGFASGSMGIQSVDFSAKKCDKIDVIIATSFEGNNDWKIVLNSTAELGVTLTSPAGGTIMNNIACKSECSFEVNDPQLWWPVGYGPQPVYTLTVCNDCGCENRDIGFRQVKIRPKDEAVIPGAWSLVFNREHNIVIKGVNMIPTSAFRDSTDEEIDSLFYSMLELGVNLVRIWGGGFYGSEYFYSKANRLGILVWEELKFAGATYDIDNEEFMENVREEIRLQLSRIHSNPSLVLVSMDNEVAAMLGNDWFDLDEAKIDLLTYRYQIFQKELTDVTKPFIVSGITVIPTSPWEGFDMHYYNYTSNCLDVKTFPESILVSEFGYQSWCGGECLGLSDGELNEDFWDSNFMRLRQHRATGNEEIWNQSKLIFSDLDQKAEVSVSEFIWLSQTVQAVCLKSATETFRRQQDNTGVMVWQLNDVWPTASWSLTGFGGRRKPSHFIVGNIFKKNEMVSLFVDGDEWVAGVRIDVGSPVDLDPITVYIVDLFSGKFRKIVIENFRIENNDFHDIIRMEIPSDCKSGGACIAAVSPENYILLGPVDRRRFESKSNPVSVELSSDKKKVKIVASVPTPFIYVFCESDSAVNTDSNFLFLAPKVFSEFEVEMSSPCSDLRFSHLWSFTDRVTTYDI